MKRISEVFRFGFHTVNVTSCLPVCMLTALVAANVRQAFAGYAVFSRPTDTISVNGNTVATDEMTIEAEVRIPCALIGSPLGRIFAEQLDGKEDKGLEVQSSDIAGGAWPGLNGSGIEQPVSLAMGFWHDIAFVRDQDQERLYVDGSLIAARNLLNTPYDGPIRNANGSLMSIGGYQYSAGGEFDSAFLGDVEWVRVDGSALYSGASVSMPSGIPAPDTTTQLLFDFSNVSPGSSTVPDLSSNHFQGTVGVGANFSGTAPTFVDGVVPDLTVLTGQVYSISPSSGGGVNVISCSGITINAGGTLIVHSAVNHSNRQLLVVTAPGLSIAGSAGNWTGLLDLTNNDMDLPGGSTGLTGAASLATVTDQIRQGYANGSWNGTDGIISSSAAGDSKHLTALGVIQNNQGGSALFTTFDTYAVGASDILVKYTYYGDANLDGKIDGSDYSLIDNGYLKKRTGWFNGDFNYDGVVDGSDYTLIDNAFNMQGAQLTAVVATSTAQIGELGQAVPEPGMIAMLGAGGIGLLARRRWARVL